LLNIVIITMFELTSQINYSKQMNLEEKKSIEIFSKHKRCVTSSYCD
jgi:hypothetical protein